MYEVEVKFPVAAPDRLLGELQARGVVFGPVEWQRDVYYAHPARDFAATNEALRVRTVGDENWLTYKGPLVDARTKTRREIETPFAAGAATAALLEQTLQALGFRAVRAVEKRRRSGELCWRDRCVTCTWDEVPPLGVFVELEVLADEAGRTAAADALLELAAELQLGETERRSYLELLLEDDARRGPAGGL